MQIHVVQSGDTIWRIAQNYGSDMNQIVLLNELDNPDMLVVGNHWLSRSLDVNMLFRLGIIYGRLPVCLV